MLGFIPTVDKLKRHLRDPLYRNSIILMVTSSLGAVLGFVFWIVVARCYPTSEVGMASAIIPAMGLLSVLSTLGFHIGLVRYLPEAKDKAGMFNSSFTVTGLLSIVLAVIFIGGLPLWSPKLLFLQRDIPLLVIFIVVTAATCLILMQKQVFIAMRSTEFAFVQEMIWDVLKIAMVIVLVSFGLQGIVSSWGIAMIVGLVVGNILVRRVQPGYHPMLTIRKTVINKMLHFSIVSYGAEIAGVAANYIMPLLVLAVLGAESNAYFYIALRVASVLFTIPYVVSIVLLAEGAREPVNVRPMIIRAAKLTFGLLIPAIIVVLVWGDKILLLFGAEYSQNSLWLLRLLAISTIPVAVNELYVAMKRVELKVIPTVYVYSSIAALTLVTSYILMINYGLVGAGIGWIAGQGIVAIITSLLIVKRLSGARMAEA